MFCEGSTMVQFGLGKKGSMVGMLDTDYWLILVKIQIQSVT